MRVGAAPEALRPMPMRVLALTTLLTSGSALLVGQPAGASLRAGASPVCKQRLTPEERRRQKLEVGTNWPPRTSTVKGEGYQFFQVRQRERS